MRGWPREAERRKLARQYFAARVRDAGAVAKYGCLKSNSVLEILKARARIELANKGFADLENRPLTTVFSI